MAAALVLLQQAARAGLVAPVAQDQARPLALNLGLDGKSATGYLDKLPENLLVQLSPRPDTPITYEADQRIREIKVRTDIGAMPPRLRTLPERHGGRVVLGLLIAILALGLALRVQAALTPPEDVGNDAAAREALAAWPDGLQLGGGITPENATEWIDAGASHVIVTSVLFDPAGRFLPEKLKALVKAVGRNRLVIDLSCRRTDRGWTVAMNRWQTLTDLDVTVETLDRLAQIRMIGNHHRDVDRQLAALPAPQQLHQRMVVLRRQDRHAQPVGRVADVPLHVEALADDIAEGLRERAARHVQMRRLELQAHEEAPAFRIRRVLIEFGDVDAVVIEEGRHRGHDAAAIRAGDQQAGGGVGYRGHGQRTNGKARGFIAGPARFREPGGAFQPCNSAFRRAASSGNQGPLAFSASATARAFCGRWWFGRGMVAPFIMVDELIYRLNRVPDKLYVTFLDLLGVTLHPPTAATCDLTFWLSAPRDQTVSEGRRM